MSDSDLFEDNKNWSTFGEEDPFNCNYVEGLISRHSGDDYGALYIKKVNGDKVPQLIFCTPKLRYPFDHAGRWVFPKAQTIERYEKIDGTNIFAYRYKDSKGVEFVSYKTRLLPFIRQSRFGPFQEMWREALKKNPEIAILPLRLGMNLSFELWGARNPHLIIYKDVPLAASLLFARQGQNILPPSKIDSSLSSAPLLGRVDRDYIWNYQQAQEIHGQELKRLDENTYEGSEGEVWYLLDTLGNWNLFKCKPHEVEQIHWSSSGLSKNVIMATCQNAFENWEDPTVEDVKTLLREEFTQYEVEKLHFNVVRYLGLVKEQVYFTSRVIEEYNKIGMSVLENKIEVMRALSGKFQRAQMSKVFSVIWNKEAA